MLFLTDTFVSNYADDNNLYSMGKGRDIIKKLLRKGFRDLTEWFSENYMIINQNNVIICALLEIPKMTNLNLIICV